MKEHKANHSSPTAVQPIETPKRGTQPNHAEDQKKALHGNPVHRHPEQPAGQHATGSFTGQESDRADDAE
jgi:hypothetical protein